MRPDVREIATHHPNVLPYRRAECSLSQLNALQQGSFNTNGAGAKIGSLQVVKPLFGNRNNVGITEEVFQVAGGFKFMRQIRWISVQGGTLLGFLHLWPA